MQSRGDQGVDKRLESADRVPVSCLRRLPDAFARSKATWLST